MDEHESINDLCVVALLFHPVEGLLLSYTNEDLCMLTDVCDVEVGDSWPETLQRSLFAKFGPFSYEILTLSKMETFSSKALFEAPRFGLFVICQAHDKVDLSKAKIKASWTHRDEEVNNTEYCHLLFKKIAQDVLNKHYPTQLQFSL